MSPNSSPGTLFFTTAVGGLLLAGLGLYGLYRPPVPTTDPAAVAAVEVRLARPTGDETEPGQLQKKARVTATDPEIVRLLLAALAQGRQVPDDRCPSTGSITIRRRDGVRETIDIGCGYQPAFYEYRYLGRVYRMPRDLFLNALRAQGLDEVRVLPL
jgi:hypothetical protein